MSKVNVKKDDLTIGVANNAYASTYGVVSDCFNRNYSVTGGSVISNLTNCEITINKDAYFKRYDVPGSYIYLDSNGTLKQTYIKYVLYRNPATIVFWGDGTKTVCKVDEKDSYCPESGLAICVLKKLMGASEVKDTFTEWVPSNANYSTYNEVRVDLRTLIKKFGKKKKALKKNSK